MGPGGGGGGSGARDVGEAFTTGAGGTGALCGGGGGGPGHIFTGGTVGAAGSGAKGCIVVTYTPGAGCPTGGLFNSWP